ncbi:Helix-turn-helix domain protein [Clostridium sp. C105KSO14]|uniref:helix-turn-helix domain-containing protein n=1 Tax=Enterocloster clostridioformis TaxID=1531 RepID=UPI0007406D19|nr:helix-turn-helix domain-containing protein [Enterocloster clostridioformis]CUX71991.1 Helix-turn-helix domain protein [Clostridium sp. C105KSO14]
MIYNNVKEICDKRKISITRMENELGFSRGSICKWNDTDPGVSKVKKVADYLKVKIDKLIS